MKTLMTAIASAAALTCASAALADNHTEGDAPMDPRWAISGTTTGVKYIATADGDGGMWTESLSYMQGEETVTITSTCVGMELSDATSGPRRALCEMEDGEGAKGAVVYDCVAENEQGNEMSCMGRFTGSEGFVKDHVALQSVYYVFGPGGAGEVTGSVHWIK